ncbi:hypothetical protein [Olleya sp. YS]|uniref:hypothetical protein n=1 Tax=Olleya sp. YS TaxID=3028318 RepID=UPI0024345A05|nr:hypothetical protein [Olleya sp. YS]WGD34592.1 hypothetical protein Ollyesu_12480 [Olleya sp. YS]
MDNKQLKSTKERSKHQEQTKNSDVDSKNKEIVLGSVVATLIALTPFLFNLYKSVPDRKIWNTFLFTYDSKYYESALIMVWTLSGQVIPLFLLLIWFFTSRHWWYHSLLIPIAMYVYQIIETLNSDLYFTDRNLITYLLPIMIIVVPSIYLVRARIFNRLNTIDKSTQELEDELTFKPKTLWGKIKQYF